MAADLVALLAVNAAFAATGLGAVLALGLDPRHRPWSTSLLAYLLGLAVVGVVAANVALLDFVPGLAGALALAAVSLAAGSRMARRRGGEPRSTEQPAPGVPASVAVAGAVLALAVVAVAVRPFVDWDGWAIWALHARALHELGGASSAVFHNDAYAPAHRDYPLLLPALQAIAFESAGGFSARVAHLQLAGFAAAFAGALWRLSTPRLRADVVGLALAAILTAPALLLQLRTNYADVPLALFAALGVSAAALWLADGKGFQLGVATVALAAAAATKTEGVVFAVSAYAALAAVVRRAGLPVRSVVVSAVVVASAVAPWRAYVRWHGLEGGHYGLARLADPAELWSTADRVPPAAGRLVLELFHLRWGFLAALMVVSLAVALRRGATDVGLFAAAWLSFSFAALTLVYWLSRLPLDDHLASSASRTVSTLVVGGAALSPLLVMRARRV